MRESDGERRRRFDALFTSYSSDIVAYCCWRADSASDAQDAVAEAFRSTTRSPPRRRRRRVAATAVTMAVFLIVGSPGAGVANAAAAVRKAASSTAASAERSGTAVVRITHDGRLWTGATIRWHDQDLAVSRDGPGRSGNAGSKLLVVGGTLYGIDPVSGGRVELGSPQSIDPDSGTTPDEYLAAVREDVGGVTLRRIVDGMTGLTTRQLGDGSTVYSGTVAAALIARETGVKEGQAIRVLPFGYVAHDEAANPAAPLRAAVTVGAGGIVREISVTRGDQRIGVDLHGRVSTARRDPRVGRAGQRATAAESLAPRPVSNSVGKRQVGARTAWMGRRQGPSAWWRHEPTTA